MNQNSAAATIEARIGPGLGPKNPTAGKGGRAPLPHAISGISVDTSQGKAKKRGRNSDPIPALSHRARRIVTVGVAFAGLCAAALSAPTLFNLARLGRVPVYLAWLLPACLDGYAITSIQFGNLVPAAHPAHGAAKRNARHALYLSVGGNFAYHVLVLAGAMLPTWVPIALLVVILSLPPFIVDRLLHLHSLASGTAGADGASIGTAQSADEKPSAPTRKTPTKAPTAPSAPPTGADRGADEVPTAAATADEPIGTGADGSADRGANVIDMATAGAAAKRTTDQWASAALPLYRAHIRRTHGTAPNAPQLAEAIERAGLGTLGKSRARDVRKATEELHNATPWDADEREAVNR